MRHLLLACSAAVSLIALAPYAAAGYDPPTQHYSTSRLPPDPKLKTAMPVSHYRGFLRVSVDLSSKMPPVGDQGKLGSSLAWAVAYAARSYYVGAREGRDVDNPHNEASPNYVYNAASRGDCAEGVTLTDTVDVLRKGALSLAAYPYKASCSALSSNVIATAHEFRVEGYRVLDRSNIDDIKGQLERGNPVIVPFLVSPAFEEFRGSGTFDEKGFAQTGDDQWQALTVVGYDDRRQAVRVMNSWGRGWGDDGFAWVSYPALTSRISAAIVLEAPAAVIPVTPPPQALPATWSTVPKQPTTTQAKLPEPAAPNPTSHKRNANPVALDPNDFVPPPVAETPTTPARQKKEKVATLTPTPKAPEFLPPPVKPRPATLADLDNLACGKIKQSREAGHVILHGFVASSGDLNEVKEVVAQEQKQGKDYALGDVKVAPWPLCEALDTLDKALVDPSRPELATTPAGTAKAGDLLRITLESPAKPSYLYLSYFQADQTVITLAQPEGLALKETPPHSELIFGDGKNGRAKFTVGPPFGTEMLVAIASASPLFPNALPQRQSERQYLSMLRKALIYKPVASLPDRVVGAAITILKTRAD